ncbi:MAG: thymidine kinase [Clostridia bacterium]|nr:thymidine kinase [Clostridia bacterium]
MAKLYFKYGVMGSSKSAQALMCKFNYEQQGFEVTLLKPIIDKRDRIDGKIVVKSRIGLSSECLVFDNAENLYKFVFGINQFKDRSVVIVDECQFLTKQQINELKEVSQHIPVLCYGLLTNFKTELFEGSKRLIEIADSIMEIKSVCKCGRKAQVNGRFVDGKLVTDGEEIVLGGDESYKALCYNCYNELKKGEKNE